MTDKELLDEIEKEFGSHAPTPADDSSADDLDAFLDSVDFVVVMVKHPADSSAIRIPFTTLWGCGVRLGLCGGKSSLLFANQGGRVQSLPLIPLF